MARDGQNTGVNQDYFVFSNDVQMMKAIVRDNDAFMGIFKQDVEMELKEGVLVELNPIDWPRKVPMELVYNTERQLPHSARALVESLMAAHPKD